MKAVRIGFKMIEGIQYTLISCKIKKERKHQERTLISLYLLRVRHQLLTLILLFSSEML